MREVLATFAKEAIKGGHVGVVEFSQCDGFGAEAFQSAGRVGDLRQQGFDGDVTVHHLIHGMVDGSHASHSEFPEDAEVAGPATCREVVHVRLRENGERKRMTKRAEIPPGAFGEGLPQRPPATAGRHQDFSDR